MILPAISIRQPWAWAILHAGKDVENRSWPLPKKYIAREILIHVGKQIDKEAVINFLEYGLEVPRQLCTGGIVGALMFSGFPSTENTWAETHAFHWHILQTRPLPFFPCRGRLGFFEVDYPHEVKE